MEKDVKEAKQINVKNMITKGIEGFLETFSGKNVETKRILYNCIGFIGNAGGVGVSTLVNEMANIYKGKGYSVCVVDFDLIKSCQSTHYDINEIKADIKDFYKGLSVIGDVIHKGRIDYVVIKPYNILDLGKTDENIDDYNSTKILFDKLKDLYDVVLVDFNYALIYFGILQAGLKKCNGLIKISNDGVASNVNKNRLEKEIRNATNTEIVDVLNKHDKEFSIEHNYKVILPYEKDVKRCDRYGKYFYTEGQSDNNDLCKGIEDLIKEIDRLMGI